MEHAVLHALQLMGLITALGGVVFVTVLLRPAARALDHDLENGDFYRGLVRSAERWVARGAFLSAGAAFVDFFVQAAEIKGKAVFGGVELSVVAQLASHTIVGQLNVARIVCLLLAVLAVRSSSKNKWWWTALAIMGAVVCAGLVSHAAAQPYGRTPIIITQIAHIVAASVWIGVLIHLLAIRYLLENTKERDVIAFIAEVVRRFSPIALTASVLLLASGLYAVARFVGTPGAAVTSAYGLTLLLKLFLLGLIIGAGYVNYRIIRPGLLGAARAETSASIFDSGSEAVAGGLLHRFGRMLELEVTAGVLVVTVAGIVGSISPPGPDGSQRLSEAQVLALWSPDLPTTRIAHPATFYGAPSRTVDDLRYSEFTHNWSGVLVCLLGLCWLAQSRGGKIGQWGGFCWPLLLIPFGLFIAVAADPEVWLLRGVSLRQTFGDPQLLEHQLGAFLVLILVWLGWRDRGKEPRTRPLGYALPVLMVLGSLLLLGHAHSALNATEEVTNLVNVQHAIFGTLGLLAGTTRWLQLRGLIPSCVARWIWPMLIIGLGLFMTFFYREVV